MPPLISLLCLFRLLYAIFCHYIFFAYAIITLLSLFQYFNTPRTSLTLATLAIAIISLIEDYFIAWEYALHAASCAACFGFDECQYAAAASRFPSVSFCLCLLPLYFMRHAAMPGAAVLFSSLATRLRRCSRIRRRCPVAAHRPSVVDAAAIASVALWHYIAITFWDTLRHFAAAFISPPSSRASSASDRPVCLPAGMPDWLLYICWDFRGLCCIEAARLPAMLYWSCLIAWLRMLSFLSQYWRYISSVYYALILISLYAIIDASIH